METFPSLNIFILLLGLIMIGYSAFTIYKHPKKWYMYLPIFAWSLSLTALYLFISIGITGKGTPSPEILRALSIWSVVQRLHGVITMFFMVYLVSLECSKYGR